MINEDLRRLLDDAEQDPEDYRRWKELDSLLRRNGYTATAERLSNRNVVAHTLVKKIRKLRLHSQRRTFGKGAAYRKSTLFILWRDIEPLLWGFGADWFFEKDDSLPIEEGQ